MNFIDIITSTPDLGWTGFFIRAVLVGLLLGILGRLIPLRTAGGLSSFDFTFFWMMGGLMAAPLFDSKIAFKDTLTAVGTILVTHKFFALLAVKNRRFDRLLKGTPQPVINNGHIDIGLMKKNLLNNELLISELRKNDAFLLKHVQSAYFENNGHLSVLTYPDSLPVTRKDLKIPAKETVYPQLIISDGKADIKNLIKTDLNSKQLIDQIRSKGINSLKEVFLAYWEGKRSLIVKRKHKS